ncbi:MAG: DUF433 domain-containing protein [Gemmataceae bacterium]
MSTLLTFPSRKIAMSTREVLFDPNKLAETWFRRTKGVCGGAARIRNTRYTIWGLVEWRQLGLSDAEILRRHPDLTQADLNTAWGYYERNREEIDQAIRANQEA